MPKTKENGKQSTIASECAFCGERDKHDANCPAYVAELGNMLGVPTIGPPTFTAEVDGQPARVVLDGTQPTLISAPPLSSEESLRHIAEAQAQVAKAEIALKPYAAALKEAKETLAAAVESAVHSYWESRQMALGDDE